MNIKQALERLDQLGMGKHGDLNFSNRLACRKVVDELRRLTTLKPMSEALGKTSQRIAQLENLITQYRDNPITKHQLALFEALDK